ncbi:hypothetical protein ALC60_07668, partial [Trachymyrmex zeteki]
SRRDSPLKPFRKDTARAFVRRFIPHSSRGTAALPWTATPEKTATVSEKKAAGQPTGNRY